MKQNTYTVSQINSYIKNMFNQDFVLNRIMIKGEVSNCKYHTSGHIYFTLKDEGGTIACVMFAGQRKGIAFRMEEGHKVIVSGSISVYERDGKYQMYAQEIIQDGAGQLYQRFEQLKQELEEMGMFAEEYKQPIPMFSKKVGIVTAPTGAAIRDIINIAGRRNPFVQLILYPALVQGEGAAGTIIKGIKSLEKYGVDVIIVGRGGGSIEDLWAFNEKEVARAIFDCNVPIISAVGHETDTTIADYVADLRAPTPSAAAELAVYEFQTFQNHLDSVHMQLNRQIGQNITRKTEQMERMQMKLRYLSPIHQIRQKKQNLADQEDRLGSAMTGKIRDIRHRMQIYITSLQGLSPLAKLNQGYAYVTDVEGVNIQRVSQVKKNDHILIQVADGSIHATVNETNVTKREEE